MTCGYEKSLNDFHKHGPRESGRASSCKECAKKRTAQWMRDNPERHKEWRDQDRLKDPEKYRRWARVGQARRRAKLAVLRRFEFAGDPCAYCGGVATTVDHIRPIHRGGADNASNMTAACLPCNQAKGDSDLLQFLLERQQKASCP